ncbi:MAG: GyrI-like domain-containing protein [Candidatus Marinimicrobia bacterium]|nr:GyrI-like domain-containing protein [Candidatus Neomarinimicrobiota bacterium]
MKITLLVIIFILFIMLIFLTTNGLFFKPEIKIKLMGPFKFVYRDHIGPYRETGKIQNEIYAYLLADQKIETFKGIGIYYDNPKNVPPEQLRSKVGCIIEPKDDIPTTSLSNDFKMMTLEKQEMIYAEFPFKSKIAIMLGIMKVYPLMQNYCVEKGLVFRESIEIYDVPGRKIFYLMPIE